MKLTLLFKQYAVLSNYCKIKIEKFDKNYVKYKIPIQAKTALKGHNEENSNFIQLLNLLAEDEDNLKE